MFRYGTVGGGRGGGRYTDHPKVRCAFPPDYFTLANARRFF